MIKSLLHRVPFVIKAVFLMFAIIGIHFGFFYYFLNDFLYFLNLDTTLFLTPGMIFQIVPLDLFLMYVLAVMALVALVLFKDLTFRRRIRAVIKDSLIERRLEDDLPHFYQVRTLDQLATKLDAVFTLYKSFDNLKTSRIILELDTMRVLLNQVSEGVVFLDQHKVVTYVNHVFERMMKLVPGEIVGKVLVRKVTNRKFLECVDNAIEFDQKVTGKVIPMRGEGALVMNVFPIKDKFGEVVRIMIVLFKAQE